MSAGPWWTDPLRMLSFFLIPIYVAVYYVPSVLGHGAVQLKAPTYFGVEYFLLGLTFLAVMVIGCALGRELRPNLKATEDGVSERYLEALAILAIVGYVIWFRAFVMKPSLLFEVFLGESSIYLSRTMHRTIGGVTTLTQLGIAFVVLFLNQIWGEGKPPASRRLYWYFFCILGLAGIRVYVWAERLALIELLVPVGVMYFLYRRHDKNWVYRLARWLGPIVGVGALLLFFAFTEFFRSWSSHYQYHEVDFSAFVVRRILTYYYTALNNGAGMLQLMDWPSLRFEHVLMWVYRFPAMIGPIFRFTLDVEDEAWGFLTRYADPEFNNLSGIFMVFFDAGVGFGLLLGFLWGVWAGYCYRSCVERRGLGKLLYPLVYISLLEVMRLLYLSEPRALPALVAIIIGHYLARKRLARGELGYVRLRARNYRPVRSSSRFARSIWSK